MSSPFGYTFGCTLGLKSLFTFLESLFFVDITPVNLLKKPFDLLDVVPGLFLFPLCFGTRSLC